MGLAPDSSATPEERAKSALNDLVVNLELTLISVIQATILFFLIEVSSEPLAELQLERWPYIGAGLLFILLFWSRALLHTLTVIRWPLELIHNFLYIILAFLQSVMLLQLANPMRWYSFGIAYSLVAWVLFAFDQYMIRQSIRELGNEASHTLFTRLLKEQRLNTFFFIPAMIAFFIGVTAIAHYLPAYFLEAHSRFAWIQLLFSLVYQVYTVVFLSRIAPLIVAHRCNEA